jgi:hypothetical protein
MANLEGSVVEANSPAGGRFHPKIWALRFVGEESEDVCYRLLCSSRNLTFDRSWDTLLCLEGPLQNRQNAIAANHPLGAFIDLLPDCATRKLDRDWKRRIDLLARELRRTKFEAPEPFESVEFVPFPSDRWPFPKRIDRMLVVSPFVDDGLLGELAEWEAPMQLISRPESLAALQPDTLSQFEQIWTLDDGATAEPDEEETTSASDPAEATLQDVPLSGLHAKLYVAESGWDASVWTGSANATSAGFHRNVEFLVRLDGKKSRCGIDALLGTGDDEPQKGRPATFADLLRPYEASELAAPDECDLQERRFELAVDRFAMQLAACNPVAACEGGADADSLTVVLRPTAASPVAFDGSVTVRPISLTASYEKPLSLASPEWAIFDSLTLVGLTAFFAFEATSADAGISRQFVLKLPLLNVPENRDERILRYLLSDRERVLRYLLLLLTDGDASDFLQAFGSSGDGVEGAGGFLHSFFGGATLFEALVRALERSPTRIDQAAEIIAALRQSPDGEQLLPEELDAIWQPIWEVRQETLARGDS